MAPLIPIAMQLAQYVPNIIKLLTGSDKAEEVAGKVVDVAKAVTGLGKPENAVAAIIADPEKAMSFQIKMGEQQADLERMYLADTQNARAMQVAALGQDDVFSKRFSYYFAAAWSLFTMLYVTGITYYPPVSESGKANTSIVLGFLLGTAVASIFAWLFGSTKGSAEKSRMLAAKA